MKHSRAALGVLKNRYISVLKKCALINTAFLLMVPPAAAVDVGGERLNIQKWNAFYNAVTKGTDPIINFVGDVTRALATDNITNINSSFSELTINGNNHDLTGHTLTTSGETGPITIGKNQTLNINNLNQSYFTHFLNNSGTVNINGGSINNNHAQAIYNNGTLTLTDSNIQDNTTGISNTNNGTVNINNSIIQNNRNQNNRNDNKDTGAGIYNDGGTVNIVSSEFAGNYVDGAGAAINNKNGHIVIEDSRFSGNESAASGGAVDTWNNNGVSATIINSIFENNHTNADRDWDPTGYEYTGGAITNGGGTINILAVDSEHSTNSKNGNTEFTGNYIGSGSNSLSNALANVGTVNLNANAGHSIIFNDKIDQRGDSTDRANHIININNNVSVQDAAGKDIVLTNDGTIEINNTVSNQTVNLYGGTLKFGYYDDGEDWQDGIGGLDKASTDFNIHGGTISLQDGVGRYEANSGSINGGPVQWGQTATLHSDFNLAIDAIQNGDGRGEQGYGADMFSVASFNANGHKVLLTDIDLGDNSTYNGKAVSLNSTDWAGIELDENAVLQSDTTDFSKTNHLLAWNKNTGILKVGAYTLQEAVAGTAGDRVYNMNTEEKVTTDLGEMLDTGTLVINGNDKKITAQGDNAIAGITVGTGDTLTINNVAKMNGFATALNIIGGETTVNNSTLSENDTALNVASGASVTLNDTNIKGNLTNGIINAGTVNLNATAGESAESPNTVAIDNTNDIANNNGTINFNAFANAVIEVADNVIRAVGNTVNGILNINTEAGATGMVNLANVDGQTVNINKGTVTMDKATGSDVNITTGDIDITAVDNSTVDVTDGTADFGTVSNNSTVTIADGTADFNDNIASSTLALNGGTNTIADGKTVSDSKITVATGATANIAADLNDSDITTAGNTTISGDVTNTSTITANANTTISGAVSASTVNANGGKTTISAAVDDSTLSVGTNGALEVAATGNISGSTVNTAGTTTINGNVEENSQLDVTGGTTTVAGTVSDSDVNVSGGTANLQGNVTGTTLAQSNTGTLNLGTEGKEISLAGSTINSGTANLLASTITGAFTIGTGATLATTKEATIAASINGNGTISATGNELTFSTNDNASGSAFAGAISAGNGATVNLDSSYGLNTGATVSLDNSILNYDTTQTTLSNDTLFNLALNGNATANITGTGRDTHNIALSDDFWTVDGDGNIINFADAHYNLSDGFNKQKGSDVHFIKADISLGSSSADKNPQNLAFGNIALSNSELQLSNRVAGDSYTFDTLNSTGTNNFSVDVNLYLNDSNSDPIADKIIVNSSNGGKLTLTELFITNDNGVIGQVEGGKDIQLIQNKGTGNPLQLEVKEGIEILSWATNVYEYGVTSASSDGKIIDSINIAEDGPSSTDTLRDLNMYAGADGYNNRGFSFVIDESNPEESNKYNIYRDLDTTTEGTFTVLGRYDEHGHKSILSGELKELVINADSERLEKQEDGTYTYYKADGTVDKSGLTSKQVKEILEEQNLIGHSIDVGAMGNDSGEGARGSMFEIVNETYLKISNVSVEDALRKADDAIKHGAAIYANNEAEAAEVTLENTDFKNNEVRGGNGGAIANIKSAVFNIANALFSGNKASANGGAIYNADEMTINGATFENNAAQNGGAIYNDKDGTLNLKGNITVVAATETAGNDIYNAGTLNLNELKAESGENDEDAAGKIELESNVTNTADAKLNINNGTVSLSKVTNDGTLNINGGEVTLNGAITAALDSNNAATSGELNINGGSLTLADSSSITQNTMSISAGVEFSVNADQLKISEALNNAGALTFTGGMNSNTISGTGALNITGNVENTGGGITQNAITIADKGSLTTAADKIAINEDVTEKQVTNNGSLTLTGESDGLGYSVVDDENATGSLTIAGNITLGDNTISQNLLTINNGALFTANADSLSIASGSITNNGSLTLDSDKETTLGYSVIDDENAAGSLTIAGNIALGDNTINQNLLTVNDGALFTADADSLSIASGSITNNGSLTLTGESDGLGYSVIDDEKAAGSLTIAGNIALGDNTINQNLLTINNSALFTANAGKLDIAGGITNAGTLTFTGGDNANTITNNGNFEYQGTGSNTGAITGTGTTTISGTVTNGENGSIKQNAITIADSGSLTTAADKIALNSADSAIANAGKLTFTGGSNNNAITGSGTTTISGTVTNNATIGQDVAIAANEDGTKGNLTNTGTISGDVTNSGTLTSAAENLQGAIANNAGGALNLSGTLDKTISGAGTTNINDELAFESNADIKGTLNMNGGTLDLLGSKGENEGDADTSNKITDHEIGKLAGTGTIKIDGDLSQENGDSDSLIIGAAAEGTSVKIDSINIVADHISATHPDDVVSKVMNVIAGDGASGVKLELAENMSTMTSDYKYDFKVHDTISGAVEATINKTTNGLAEFIQGINGAETANTYSMTRNETSMDIPPEAIGTTGSRADGSTALNLNMNGHTLSGNRNNGITVAGDYKLNVNGSEGTVSNFNTAFTVEENGTLNLDSVIFENNQTDVANNGTLNLFGNNLIEGGITGTGSTIITSGKTEVVASIEQGSLTVNTGATLEGSAANLTITNGIITNAGTVNFTGGENKNNIANTGTITFGKDEDIGAVASNNGEITGTGTVNMTDGSANSGKIEQGTINIAANATVTNTGTMSADKALTVNTGATVTNTGGTLSGKLDNDGTISGGSVTAAEGSVNDGTISAAVTANGNFTNNNKIEGSVTANSGTANSGTFTNAGEINTGSHGEVEIASAAEFANAGTIMGDVANSGKLTNAGGAMISGMITNKGTLENLVNGKLYDVINSNTFANAGEVRDVTNNAGGTFTNTGTAGNVTNTGTFTNTGTIAGDVTNSSGATLNSELATIGGSLTNDGTFNMADASITLDKTIAGYGLTKISGAVTLGENGGFAPIQSLHVNEDATLDIAANTITLDNFTLKGQLNLAITDISANSSEYEGGKILVNSAKLTGGKMQFTVGKGLLSGKQQTGELAIINLKDDATGRIEGDLASVFEKNNLYEITKGEKEGTIIITNIATAEEVITGIGNQNQINTAGAWENIVTEDGTAVGDIQEALNTLVQHDIPQYLEALTNLAPTDSQFRLQNAKEAQNLIGRQIALRLDSSDCPTCKDPFRKTAMWMQGLGGYAKQDNRFDAAGYSAYTGGYAIGYDGNVNCDTTVGFGYAYTTTDGESHGRDMDVSAHNLFAYGKYQPSEWYLRGAFTYGAAKYDEKSDVAGHSVTAKYDVHYTGLEAALGHDFANGLTPEFGLRATHLMPDDYEDSLGQKVTNKDIFALSAAALLKYRNTYELNEYTVRPNVYAGLTYDLTDDGSNTAVRINEMNYDIIGKRLPRLGGEAGFAVEVSHDNIDLSVGYDMGYREDYISHTGMIKLRYNFN